MNNTLAAVAVAAAVGTGIYIANDTPAIVEPQTSVWKMPTIDLPELELPELTVAEFSIPSVNTDFCDLPTLTLPEITIDTAIVQNDLSKQFLTDSDMFETSELTVPELTLHISDFIGDAEKVEKSPNAEEFFTEEEQDILHYPEKYEIRFAVWDKIKELIDRYVVQNDENELNP